MKTLYVLYDGHCEFCRRCRGWLGQQAAFVTLAFIPFQSPEVTTRFPGIDQFHPEERLTVISDRGEIWRGDGAWIMCLWALRDYREWSVRESTAAAICAASVRAHFGESLRNIALVHARACGAIAREHLAAIPTEEGYCRPK